MSNPNALAVYSKIQNPILAAKEMAGAVASVVSGTSLIQGEAIALYCQCEGITPFEFARRYHWIPGKGASMRADAMLAEFRTMHGGHTKPIVNTHEQASISILDKNDAEYTCSLSRRQVFLSRWPWEGTKGNGWGWLKCNQEVYKLIDAGKTDDEIFREMQPHLKDNWGTELDWQNMLWARLVSGSFRTICPELVAGIYTPEEMQDVIDSSSVVTVDATPTKRPTAEEILKAAVVINTPTANDRPWETQPGQPADTIIEVTPTSVTVDPVQSVESPPFDSTETNGSDYPLVGGVTRSQLEKLLNLREQMQLSDTDWNSALANRKVNAAHSLTKEQAAELIDKMESRIKAAAKN